MQAKIWIMVRLAVGVFGAKNASAQFTVLSDFENRFSTNILGGYWYMYDDKNDSGESVLTTVDSITHSWDTTTFAEGAEGSPSSAKMGFLLGNRPPVCGAACTYPPMVGMGTKLGNSGTMNLTGATAVSFWAKGDSPMNVSFTVGTSEVTDNGNYAILIPVTSAWTKFTVALPPAADLKQPGWAKKIDFNPVYASSLGWSISKGDNTGLVSGAFYLDYVVIEGWKPPEDPASLASRRNRAGAAAGFRGTKSNGTLFFTTDPNRSRYLDALGRGMAPTPHPR